MFVNAYNPEGDRSVPRARGDYAIDGQLLKRLMKGPLKGGTIHTARTLGKVTGLSPGKVNALISGERPTVDAATAARLAQAVQVHFDALSTPNPFTFVNVNKEE